MRRGCEPGPARRALWKALNAARAHAGLQPLDAAALRAHAVGALYRQLTRLRSEDHRATGPGPGVAGRIRPSGQAALFDELDQHRPEAV